MKTSKAKPFLKWVGGKGKLLEQLIPLFPEKFNTFFEPFAGGGAVFFSLNHKRSVINDINSNLIGVYENIRDNTDDIITGLKAIEKVYHELDLDSQKDFYYLKRERFNNLKSKDIEKSVLFIFLNKTCFNGMYRENKSGSFNIPFGRNSNPTICNEQNLREVSRVLKNVLIMNTSFSDATKNASKGDFVYFDPPYYPLSKTSSFTSYSADNFLEEQQHELYKEFRRLDEIGCFVAMSNSNSEFIKKLYKDYSIHFVSAARSINANGKNRGKIKEVLITNY